MPCGHCDQPGHATTHCPVRLQKYRGVPADHSVGDGDDRSVWVQDPETDEWCLSMYREDDVHTCACGKRLECPVGGVRPDDLRADRLDRCDACLEYQAEDEATDGGEFVRAGELVTDGGTNTNDTERWCDGCEKETPHRQMGDSYQCLVCPERIEIEAALGGGTRGD